MGKKGRKKKQALKQAHRFMKKQFLEIYCPNCKICVAENPNPIFCYDELYKTEPETFFKHCLSGLINLKRQLVAKDTPSKDITMGQFNDLFCKAFCKKNACNLIVDCYLLFKKQIRGGAKTRAETRKNKKQRKKVKERYICQPYPTIFTNDNEEWLAKIEDILNGNNNRKQNKVEESTKQSKG